MNPSSSFSQFHNQERLAKEHRENIIYALTILKEATSGEIKKFIDKKIKSDLDVKYSSTNYLSKNKKQTDQDKIMELRQKQMSLRTVQKWLIRLEKEYLVTKNKYNVYRLTTQGSSEKIFGESYGKMLFNDIAKPPLTGTPNEKWLEAIRRIGVYISYILVNTMWDKAFHKSKEEKNEWINDVINPSLIFEWFSDEFKSFKTESSSVDSQSVKYLDILKNAEIKYYTKIYPNLRDKQIEALKRSIDELKKELGRS